MAEAKKCSQCGAELAAHSPGGHCLACLLKLGLPPENSEATQLKPGDHVGRYQLLEKIGEGGCGVVFLAEQEEPVQRQVALKVIKPGMDTHEVIARFEAERQLLALLDHPNIAKVFDARATESGRPFFVMEMVRGLKITDYCDREKLSTRERLELFIPICQAMQHAHQKGIIHRDLKPSNILVTPGANGAAALPRIIDFGIAKFTGPDFADPTTLITLQQFIGTPAYMSPEQAGLDGVTVDARSDIYSLGVLLYELLTGLAPFDATELRRCAIDQILQFIRETEPPRPSQRLTKLTPPELTTVAASRQIEPTKLPRLLRGDLDWIVMKCLEKDRTRRYETAFGLATDLQHYLASEPVLARPPTGMYRLQKMARRHRLLVCAAGAVVVATLIGVGFSARFYLHEKTARRKADEAEATALSNMGAALWGEGRFAEAEAKYRQVLAMREKLSGNDNPSVAIVLNNLATVLLSEGKSTEAETLNRRALDMDRKFLGNEHQDVAIDMGNLASILAVRKKFAEAESLDREALAIDRKISGDKNPDVPVRLANLAKDLAGEGNLDAAEAVRREAEAVRKAP